MIVKANVTLSVLLKTKIKGFIIDSLDFYQEEEQFDVLKEMRIEEAKELFKLFKSCFEEME